VRTNPQGVILAPPAAAVGAIQHAFTVVGSPLADTRPRRGGDTYAEYLWDAARRAGVDPAVVLAFFWVESHDGTQGVAVQTHSLFNARPVGNEPVVYTTDGCYAAEVVRTTDGCYAAEPDWFAGIDRTITLLAAYARADILVTPGATGLISINLRNRTSEESIRLVAASAGLTVARVGGAFIVGPAGEAEPKDGLVAEKDGALSDCG